MNRSAKRSVAAGAAFAVLVTITLVTSGWGAADARSSAVRSAASTTKRRP
jgi:hypothetical protein